MYLDSCALIAKYRRTAIKYAVFMFFIIGAAYLQLTLADYIRILGVKPDLFIVCIVCASLLFDHSGALVLSALSGFLKDVFLMEQPGANIFASVLVCYAIISLLKKIEVDSHLRRCALCFLAVLFNDIIRIPLNFITGMTPGLGVLLRISLIEAVLTAAIFPFMFTASERLLSLAASGFPLFPFAFRRKRNRV